MKEGQPTYEQLCRIIGSVYSDAYLRLEFLEDENKKLRSAYETLRKENAKLKVTQCDNGNGNSMLPESLQEKLSVALTGKQCTSSPPPGNND